MLPRDGSLTILSVKLSLSCGIVDHILDASVEWNDILAGVALLWAEIVIARFVAIFLSIIGWTSEVEISVLWLISSVLSWLCLLSLSSVSWDTLWCWPSVFLLLGISSVVWLVAAAVVVIGWCDSTCSIVSSRLGSLITKSLQSITKSFNFITKITGVDGDLSDLKRFVFLSEFLVDGSLDKGGGGGRAEEESNSGSSVHLVGELCFN